MLISSARRRAFRLVELLVVAGIVALAVCVILPAIVKAREAAHRRTSENNLKQIALATIDCADNNECLLPLPGDAAYPKPIGQVDKDGRRVRTGFGPPLFHILPYLGSNDLYQSSYSDEDGLYSSKRLQGVPISVFQAPYDPTRDPKGDSCSYAANELAFCWPDGKGLLRYPAAFSGGTSQIILYAEQYAHQYGTWGTGWTDPRMFRPYTMNGGAQVPKEPPFQVRPRIGRDAFDGESPQSFSLGGLVVVMADGSARFVNKDVKAKKYYDSCTLDGGWQMTPDW
jgi:type II secretory pathway pseudopilin PulG